MSYHEMLGLDREPFGNSPDPDFFHSSPRHAECLRRLEIAVRLKRGLCVVMGEVGTGKTTVCRRLLRTLSYDPAMSGHLLLDPCFEDPRDFLAAVAVSFGIRVDGEDSAARIREAIQEFLLATAASGEKTVVLCVDEGQKITGQCLEILRELLNFEVNTHKLVQIVVFAQNEFAGTLRSRKNLADRINTRIKLKPLSFFETKRLIRTRLRLAAGESWKDRDPALFTRAALFAIYRACGGYPRRIMRLCHAALLETVGREKARAGLSEVRAALRAGGMGGMSWRAAAVAALPVAAVLAMLIGPGRERTVEMLDTGLIRLGQTVAMAPDALPELPGYGALRGLLASVGIPAPQGPSEPGSFPVAPDAVAPATEASPVAPFAPAAPVVPVAAPAETAATAMEPAAAPLAAPLPTSLPDAAHVAEGPEASATQALPHISPESLSLPQLPVDVAAQADPAPLPALSPEALRVVPGDVSPAMAEAAASPASGLASGLASGPVSVPAFGEETSDPVIIEVASLPAAVAALQAEPESVPAADIQAMPASVVAHDAAREDAPAVSAEPPRVLGEMVMRPGWNLSKAAARLYGNGGRRVMQDVAAANPDIADLDLVRPGARVAFPARQAEPLPGGACVVLLDRAADLDAAFAALARLREEVSQAVLYAHFSSRTGLTFDVVLNRYHADAASAQAALEALPRKAAATARVVAYGGDVAVAYSALEPASAGAPATAGSPATVRTVAQNATAPR